MTKVLFSPIGDTDPMRDYRDGSLLHIIRHYQPDIVYLFLSKEMNEREEKDKRYTRSVELLAQHIGKTIAVTCIPHPTLSEAHRYDLLLGYFREKLSEIRTIHPDAQILLNVSSGTPAMKSALVVLDAFAEFPMTAIQVSTPKRGSNARVEHEDADVETQWRCNEDNVDGAESRCERLESPHLADMIIRESVKKLVKSYDYGAALMLLHKMVEVDDLVLRLTEGAMFRLALDHQRAVACFAGTEFCYDRTKDLDQYLFYLEVLVKRRLYADFVRAQNPAYVETAIRQLEKAGAPRTSYLGTDKPGDQQLQVEAIRRDDRLSRALAHRLASDKDRDPHLNNFDLEKLMEEYLKDPPYDHVYKKLRKLHKFQTDLRNTAAHSMQKLGADEVRKKGFMSAEKVIAQLCSMNGVTPGLYDRINKVIVEALDI